MGSAIFSFPRSPPEVARQSGAAARGHAAAQSEYARLAGLSPAALTAAVASCLPIVRVLVLLGGAMPALRERLIQRVEATLRSEDLI